MARKKLKMGKNEQPRGDITEKNHPYREPKARNELTVNLICPYHEAIIDENRIETALRQALAVPDLEVRFVTFEVKGPA